MRIMRRALLAAVAGLVLAAAVGVTGAAGVDASRSWVQPPASVPIAAPTPALPAVVGPAHLWVQPPAWIPIGG